MYRLALIEYFFFSLLRFPNFVLKSINNEAQ